MGFSDFMKKAADITTAKIHDKFIDDEAKLHANEQAKMTKVSFKISSGFNQVGAKLECTMFQRADGTIYFDKNYNDQFDFIDYDWNGPRFDVVSSSQSDTSGREVTKGKSGRMATGALIGTILMPGVGTAVGAAIGAGSKKKKDKTSKTLTNSTQSKVEVFTPAVLKFKNLNTGENANIVIQCNSIIDSQIKCFAMKKEQSVKQLSSDNNNVLKGIKALKELLDMGAITQEEFDERKNKLLDSLN